MKEENIYKSYQIVMIVVFSMAVNLLGRIFADANHLPLWLDCFGTFLTCYLLGPGCGVMVGISGNILHGFLNPISFIYAITSFSIAVITGYLAKRGWMASLLKTMSLSVLVTIVCSAISCLVNFTFYGGEIGNEWGQGVADTMSEWGLPHILCVIIGQFYLDFLDKVVTLCSVYFFIRIYRLVKGHLPKIFILQKSPVLLLFMIAGLLIFHPQKTFAEERQYNSFAHTIYNKENGIFGGRANDIASTNDGILWIGTYEGLYRHNGQDFRLMNEFDSIKTVRTLYVDDEGRLFVGTNDNGLSIIINEKVMNVLEEKDGLPADSVRSITRGTDGLYYVGTAESLAILSIADGLNVVETLPQIQTAISMSASENGLVAAVTSSGKLFVLNYTDIVFDSEKKGFNEKFTAAVFSADGRLFAATESNRIIIFSISDSDEGLSQTASIACEPLRHINSLDFFDDRIFVCADDGAGYLEKESFFMLETGTFNNSIDNMTEDYQGNLWFTSSRLGVLKMCETSFSEIYVSGELPASVVNSTAFFKNNLYIGTDDGLMAINMENGKALTNKLTKSLSATRIRCLTSARDGSLWIATKSQGLIHAKSESDFITIAPSHQFRVVIELFDGTLAAGSNDGVAFVKNERILQWISEKEGLENTIILSLSETDDGRILAGTDGGGLAVISPDSEADSFSLLRLIKRVDGLASNVILRTINDRKGTVPTDGVFVVTSNGLCYIDFADFDGERFTGLKNEFFVRTLSNFPYSNNYDLILYDKNVFVLSSAGIFVVNREELLSGESLDYELLDMKKGLRGSLTANSWNYLAENGDLYLSCDAGASKFNLNSYDKAKHSYRMQLKNVIIDGKNHIVQKDIPFVIPPTKGTIEIVPEIINYSINTPFISAYLEGIDENPAVMLQSKLTSLSYSNLPAGEYRFHIAVLDSKGKNTLEETVYTISKSFRISDNWWFMVYIVGVAMLAIAWLTWFITTTLQEKRLEKQKSEMEAIRQQVRMGNETIFSIANAVEARDKRTGRHSYRVAEYAVLIARELGFSEEEQTQIRRTGLLHDIGKIGVPDAILNKTDRLTDEEYEIMKTHTLIGGEILKDFTLIPHVDEGARFHHEHYDGSGYPNGLKGEEIPLNARIIGIADAFDAMTANRIYRKALSLDYTIEEMKKASGKQFDPGLVEIMLELLENGKLNVEKTFEESVNAGRVKDEK